MWSWATSAVYGSTRWYGRREYYPMGRKVNVQDGAIIHCTYQKTGTHIGNNVSIGHNAIVHGCVIEDNVPYWYGRYCDDHCVVGSNSIIAAGAVVLENTKLNQAHTPGCRQKSKTSAPG